MSGQNQNIQAPDTKSYFTMLPNLIDDSDLDPYEHRLLCHYYRVGNCWESTKTTAEKCKMGAASVSRKRKSLEKKGWIKITQPKHESDTIKIVIVDKWAENFSLYQRETPPRSTEEHPFHTETPPRSTGEPKNIKSFSKNIIPPTPQPAGEGDGNEGEKEILEIVSPAENRRKAIESQKKSSKKKQEPAPAEPTQSKVNKNSPEFKAVKHFYAFLRVTAPYPITEQHTEPMKLYLRDYFPSRQATMPSIMQAVERAILYAQAQDLTITQPRSIRNLAAKAKKFDPERNPDVIWQKIETFLKSKNDPFRDGGLRDWFWSQDEITQKVYRKCGGDWWIKDRPHKGDVIRALEAMSA